MIQMHICVCRGAVRANKIYISVSRQDWAITWRNLSMTIYDFSADTFSFKIKMHFFFNIFRRFSFPPLIYSTLSTKEKHLPGSSWSQTCRWCDGSRNHALPTLRSPPKVWHYFRSKKKKSCTFFKYGITTVTINTK